MFLFFVECNVSPCYDVTLSDLTWPYYISFIYLSKFYWYLFIIWWLSSFWPLTVLIALTHYAFAMLYEPRYEVSCQWIVLIGINKVDRANKWEVWHTSFERFALLRGAWDNLAWNFQDLSRLARCIWGRSAPNGWAAVTTHAERCCSTRPQHGYKRQERALRRHVHYAGECL